MSGEFCTYFNYFWIRNLLWGFFYSSWNIGNYWNWSLHFIATRVKKKTLVFLVLNPPHHFSITFHDLKSVRKALNGGSSSLLCRLLGQCSFTVVPWHDIVSSSSPLIGRVPQVAVKPRRAPQKRRLMGSTDLSSCCVVSPWMLNHPWLERCVWTRLEWEWFH